MDNVSLKAHVRAYAKECQRFCIPSVPTATFQFLTTLVSYVATITLMMLFAKEHYGVVLLLVPLASGLMIRLFTIQHDCGHGSYLPSKMWNDALGHLLSVITFTPYEAWKREHAAHHAGSAHLERRGVGDIDMLTVREYVALSRKGQRWYRLMRNPLVLVLIEGPIYFLILNRFPWGRGFPARDVWQNIVGLDIALVLVFGALSAVMSFETVVSVFGPVGLVASGIGVWLFYVQHQFDTTHWYDGEEWDFQVAALYGSSYYKLPRVLAWFTGNIGFHHIHHLNSKIPSYKLPACLEAMPELETLNRVTFWDSLRCTTLKLWDEENKCLVGFP